ncbi:MAG: M6 family metalloprotease domain-containing protein [Paludibacteraceae bacterium]|nr:M6 family metalloprotease domain-containing protein [Paludibacteraceae bacterium]
MIKITKATRLVLLAAGLLIAAAVWAAPAIDTQVDYRQPDGSTVSSYLHGDEFFHYQTTDDGYVVVENKEGYLEYADPASASLQPSGHRVNGSGMRSTDNFKKQLTKGLTPAQQAFAESEYAKNRMAHNTQAVKPLATVAETAGAQSGMRAANHKGNLKFLVILVDFTDKKFSKSQTEFNNMLNQQNFNGTGSTRDFYMASSWNQFQPTFEVWGPVNCGMTSAEAKASTPTMIYNACQIIDSWGCDFSQFDTDNDGIVDNVYCFFAGYDQAQGGDGNCIWSHASSIYWKHQYAPDGKWINGYGCSSELKGNSGQNRVNIGTFTHEFGHVIGLPDFYITSGSGHSPGNWDTMAGGCYLNDSQSPPLFSAYEREMLGWCTIPTLPSGTVTIPNMQDNKNTPAYRVNTSKNNEWYILEYRVRTQYRNYGLPSNGMLIWHVDRSLSGWNSNNPNGTSGHPGYDVYECNNNGTYANVGNGDAPWGQAIMWPFGGRNAVNLVDWAGQTSISLNSITDHSTYATVNSGGSSGGGGTSCTQDDAPVAWVFQDANYGGEKYGLGEGNFKRSDILSRCIGDDWISSIKVLPGYKVVAYADDNFTGTSVTWTSDQTYVGNDWNDKITSIKVMPNGTTGKSGLWKIKNRNSGKYWDCSGNTTADNTQVVQWADEGLEAYQQWELQEVATGVYHIRPASNLNTRVEVYYGNKDNGTGLVMYPQTENYWNAEFILFAKGSGYFQLIARHCGKPLEMAGSTTDNGAQVKIYDNNGTNAQQWQLLRNQPDGCGHATFYADCNYEGTAVTLSEGYYDAWQLRLYGIGNDQLSSLKVKPGYKVTLWDGEGTGTSKVYTGNVSCLVADNFNDKTSSIAIDPVGKSGLAGTYQVQGKNSKLYWGIKNASKANSADLQQQALNATASQTWTLSEYGNTGVYCITNVNSGKVLDVNSAVCTSSAETRASISQYTYTEGAYHQQFIAVDKGSGFYQFVDRHSGMVIEVPSNNTSACDLKMWANNDQACSQWKLMQPSYDKWVISADEPTGEFKDVRWNDIYAWSGVEGTTTTGPKEGNGAIAWTINPTDTWWGWGIHNTNYTLDMSQVKNWYICFAIKTTCTDELSVKVAGTNGEYSVALKGTYAITTNGNWNTMCIPFSAFTSQGMQLGSQTGNVLFSIVCENVTNGSRGKRLEIDNVYYASTPVTITGAQAVQATAASVSLYPNPAVDAVTVNGVTPGETIVVYDLLGRAVKRTTATESTATFSIASLPQGNYMVRVGNTVMRLVK